MRIGVDLDDVVYPFIRILGDWISEATGRPRAEMPPGKKWNFYQDWGYTRRQFLKFYKDSVNAGFMFSHGTPIEGSTEGMQALKDSGHSIHIVTDRAVGRIPQANTELWLRSKKIPFDSITYGWDKTLVRSDFFIDDKPSHVISLRQVGCNAFLFHCREDQEGFPPEWTVENWLEFVERCCIV